MKRIKLLGINVQFNQRKSIFSIAIIALLSIVLLTVHSCNKDNESFADIEKDRLNSTNSKLQTRNAREGNSDEPFTILGRKRNNPYTVANMTQAYNKLYKSNYSALPVTHYYVKFLPNTHDHIAILEEWETEKQIALFDFPLEYEIITQGENTLIL